MAVYRGKPYLIECKTTRNLTAFPLYYGATRSVPKHQVSASKNIERNGGVGMILIRREEPRNKRCFALLPSQAEYLYSEYGKKRKSVPWSWFEENCTELDRLAKPVRWNLTKLFNDLI
jgi:penicillin-binding protein-related factor A (putative recombinase)